MNCFYRKTGHPLNGLAPFLINQESNTKMKRIALSIAAALLGIGTSMAVDENTVVITYEGTTATVEVASNISNYITDLSNGSSHVRLEQSSLFSGNAEGEIIYVLSGSSDDGEFYLEGSYKCTVELNDLTLTNPTGPAMNIQNGKRVEVSAKNGTVNTLTDGANEDYNGCFHCKGHTKLKGKGTLNIVGNSKHALYSKEYVEVKNLTLNITAAVKDGIHCKEYFLMESGTVNITGAADDAIQVELSGQASTGTTSEHEDEDSGNFYQEDGTLTLSGYEGKAIKADGSINFNGGVQDFDKTDVTENALAGIETVTQNWISVNGYYDLNGRRYSSPVRGFNLKRIGTKTVKMFHR